MIPGRGLLLSVLLGSVTARAADAQTILNVEQLSASEEPGIHAAITGTATLLHGNVNLVQADFNASAAYRTGPHWLRLFAGSSVLRQDGTSTLNSRSVHLRYTHISESPVRTYAFAQAQSSERLLLRHRLLLGGGARVVVLNRGSKLEIGAGPMLESEQLNPPTEETAFEPDPTQTVRLSALAVATSRIRDGVEFQLVSYYQPKLSAPADARVLNSSSLRVALTSRLSLISGLEWRYDSRPPADIRHSDVALNTTISYSLR